MADPICARRCEFEERPRALKEVEIAARLARAAVDSYNRDDERYQHINKDQIDVVMHAIKECEVWLTNCSQLFGDSYMPCMEPPVLCREILDQRKILESTINPILNSPKPTANKTGSKEGTESAKAESNSGNDMDVD